MPSKTAYFVFTEENRALVHRELNEAAAAAAAAAAEGSESAGAAVKSVSVAVVAKELGARWRALPEGDKARYKEIALQQSARAAADAAAAAAAAPAAAAAEAAEGGGDDAAPACDDADGGDQGPSLPRGTVKRIMGVDPEFKRASADAVWLISAAAEALLGLVVERAARQALAKKRRTVKLEDLQHVVKYDKRLVEAGLRDVVDDSAMYEEAAAAAAAKSAAGKAAKPPKQGGSDAGSPAGNAGGDCGAGGGRAAAEGGRVQQQQGGRKKRAAQDDRGQRKLSAFFMSG